MPVEDLPKHILESLSQHVPVSAAWLPWVLLAAIALGGLLLMVRGARLAPLCSALVFAAIGGSAATQITNLLPVSLWPAVVICAAIGLALGLLLFRLWLAVFLAACLLVAGLGAYSHQALREPLNSYLTRGLDAQQQLVTLQDISAPRGDPRNAQAELSGLWSHLSGSVPRFQATFSTIAAGTILIGLALGLLLPKVARAVWAASIGTGAFALSASELALKLWPPNGPPIGQWCFLIAGALWIASLLFNLADMYNWRRNKAPKPVARQAAT